MTSSTPKQSKMKEEYKANLARVRQRKELVARIMTRHKQLKDGKVLAVTKAKVHNENMDCKTILNLQETARELKETIDGAKKHFNTFRWRPQFLTTYQGMLKTFTDEAADQKTMEALVAKPRKQRTEGAAGPSNTVASSPTITPIKGMIYGGAVAKGKAPMTPIMFGNSYEDEEDVIERSNADQEQVLDQFMHYITTQPEFMDKVLEKCYNAGVVFEQSEYARVHYREEPVTALAGRCLGDKVAVPREGDG